MRSIAPRESAARRYRIEKYLTEGGMGAIYLGKKMGSGGFQKEVVLKQLLPEYTSRPEFRDLFFREAKISATLDHANIVHTFDLVESDQSLFIVMEYVRGADLRTILRRARQRQRELSPAAAIHIALEILAGLTYAHTRRDQHGNSLNIIHRDVSPSNIICSVQGEAKLSDFGIAKASTHSSVFYRVRGKVGYMSPEQARSQPIDHRCDLFSLAVCLYESLSGERLFVGDLNTPADEIYGHAIAPVSEKRPGLPRALDEVLARALAPNIADRQQSGPELSDALRTVAHKTGLAFSAPELAAHLRDILGGDTARWLRDDSGTPMGEPPKVPAAGIGLVGKEAASIGIVADVPEDEQAPVVLSPSSVSGSKDFDLDSMLDDEATRPGGRGPAPLSPSADAITPDSNSPRRSTPPPVWTRSSGPIPIVTPPPARGLVPPPAMAAPQPRNVPATVALPPARTAPPPPAPASRAPQPPRSPPPPVPLLGRSLPRPTQRGMPVPPPLPVAPKAVPPPPPARRQFAQEFEDATPPPPLTPPPFTPPPPASFDIDESPPAARSRPSASTLLGLGSGPHPLAQGAPGYTSSAAPSAVPSRLSQPQTLDFSGSATLPEKPSGPPRWLTVTCVAASLVGGALLGHRVTRSDVANVTTSRSDVGPGRRTTRPAPDPETDVGAGADKTKPSTPPPVREPLHLLPVETGSAVDPAAGAEDAPSGAASHVEPAPGARVRPHPTKQLAKRRRAAPHHRKPARH